MRIKNKKLRIFLSRKVSVGALLVLMLMVFGAIAGPSLIMHDPMALNAHNRLQGVSWDHWMGTDAFGRDIFTRLVHGAPISMGLALFGVSIGFSFGLVFGIISGYYGGLLDALLSRAIDFLMAIPPLMIGIFSLIILGSGGINTGIAVGISSIPLFMRMTRGQVIIIKNLDYVKSSRMIGLSDFRIIITHILPGIMPLIVVTFTLQLGMALLLSSTLSFLGIGVNPPTPEWGSIMADSRTRMLSFPLGTIAPGIAITLFVMCTSLIGDGLRDAFDTKTVEEA